MTFALETQFPFRPGRNYTTQAQGLEPTTTSSHRARPEETSFACQPESEKYVVGIVRYFLTKQL